MHIIIAGLGGLALVIIILLAVLLLGGVIGYIWAGKRRYMARRDELVAESDKRNLALEEREFLQDRRQVQQDERELTLNAREDALDERDRDLCGQEAEMDQRLAALAESKRMQGASLS